MEITSCVLLLATWSKFYAADGSLRPRVYLGTEDLNHEFPFVVSLQYMVNPLLRTCSGSVISGTWVLTAGHCVTGFIPIIVRYADFTLLPNETKAFAKVKNIFKHPNYRSHYITADFGNILNDNALILTEKVPDMAFGKISAVDYKTLLGLPVKYAGFGLTVMVTIKKIEDIVVKEMFRPLQVGEGLVVSCRPMQKMNGPSICVRSKCSNRDQKARPGDSGGPVVYNGKIVGVMSAVLENEGGILYCASISPNLQWIQDVMNDHH